MILRQRNHWSTLIVAVGYLAATLTGFLRQSILAFHLGAGRETDIFLVAFSVPEFFSIALPIVLSPVIIPLFARVRGQGGEAEAARLARRFFGWYAVFFAGCGVGLWILAPVYVPWLSPGFQATEQAGAVALARWMLPAIFWMGASALATAVLQVYRRFSVPALVTVVYNLVFAGCLQFLPFAALQRVGWAVVFAALSGLLMQLPLLIHLLRMGSRAPDGGAERGRPVTAAQVMALMLPFAAGYGMHHIILWIDRAMATTLGWGDAAAISYARNLSLVIVQVSGLAVSTVMFPALAEQMGGRGYDRARAGLGAAMRWVWAVAAPAAAVMVVLREPLVRFLFERGAFDRDATATVSLLLAAYAVGALADALCQPLWRVLYAQGSPWTVLWVNFAQTAVRVAANVALVTAFGVVGLALSAALGLALQALILAGIAAVRLKVSGRTLLNRSWLREAGWVLVASGLAAAIAGLASVVLQPAFPAVGRLLVAGGAAGAVYAVIMVFFGDARSIWRGIKAI